MSRSKITVIIIGLLVFLFIAPVIPITMQVPIPGTYGPCPAPPASCNIPTAGYTYFSSPTYAIFHLGIVYLPNMSPAPHAPGLYWMSSGISTQ